MATIKEATAGALQFAVDVLGPERTESIRLEEVETGNIEGEECWLITFSMVSNIGLPDVVKAIAGHNVRREYKTFAARKSDGQIKSMKIRELSGA